MACITIHNVKNVEIEKYQLDSGTWVCKIVCNCITSVREQESCEEISLFSKDKRNFDNLIETN